jgi:hypothetical protein
MYQLGFQESKIISMAVSQQHVSVTFCPESLLNFPNISTEGLQRRKILLINAMPNVVI